MWFVAVVFMAGLLGDVQTAGNHQPEVQVAINSASVVGKTQQGGETRGVACRRVVPSLYHHLASLRRVVQRPTYPLNVDDKHNQRVISSDHRVKETEKRNLTTNQQVLPVYLP